MKISIIIVIITSDIGKKERKKGQLLIARMHAKCILGKEDAALLRSAVGYTTPCPTLSFTGIYACRPHDHFAFSLMARLEMTCTHTY